MYRSVNKWLPVAAVACWLWAGCLPRPAIMNPARPVSALPSKFFSRLPALLQLDNRKRDFSGLVISDAHVLAAGFTEKYIEKDNLLTYSSIGEKSNYPVATYDDVRGATQQLFLYHIQTSPAKLDAVLYLAARYNEDGVCIGLGPSYLGYVDDVEGHIDFLYSLAVKIDKGDTCLVADRSMRSLQKLAAKKQSAVRIVFLAPELKRLIGETTPAYWERLGTNGIRVSKIIEYDPNKVGGRQPVIFDIPTIMRDEKSLPFLPKFLQP